MDMLRPLPLPPKAEPKAETPPKAPPPEFTGVTIGARIDHHAWTCRFGYCSNVNPLHQHDCMRCQNSRRPPADALGDCGQYIGFLLFVDTDRDEHWWYPDSVTLYWMSQGVVPEVPRFGPSDFSSLMLGSRKGNEYNSPPTNTSAPGPSGAGDSVETNTKASTARNSDGHAVSHMERSTSNVRKAKIDDEDLEDQGQQPEDEEGAQGGAAGGASS
ncbi:hypothetical protein F52700_7989 [Fusarium sp. NRRL 52700]|nr:hypothetical protein F52700_7989 [Fusarium sp. NRRL 52700]